MPVNLVYPTVNVSGTDNYQVSWFSGDVPIDPNEVLTVPITGQSSYIVDTGFGTPLRGVNVNVNLVSSTYQASFFVQTSDDLITWRDAATHDASAIAVVGDNYIRFSTRRQYFRLSWRGYRLPEAGTTTVYPRAQINGTKALSTVFWFQNGATFPAGTYTIEYLSGCFYGNTPTGLNGLQASIYVTDGNGNNVPFSLPGTSGTGTPALFNAYYAGSTITYNHVGGKIGVQSSATISYGDTPNTTGNDGTFQIASPGITVANFYPGNYRATYLYGGYDWCPFSSSNRGWVNLCCIEAGSQDGFPYLGPIANLGGTPEANWSFDPNYMAPGQQTSLAALEAYYAGYYQQFVHPGGALGIYNAMVYPGGTIDGSPQMTWTLESEDVATFSWGFMVSETGGMT